MPDAPHNFTQQVRRTARVDGAEGFSDEARARLHTQQAGPVKQQASTFSVALDPEANRLGMTELSRHIYVTNVDAVGL